MSIVSDDPHLGHGRLLTLLDLDELFARTPNARIVNNDTLVGKKLSEDFKNAVYRECDGELGFVPSCACGATTGVMKKGTICPRCGTECSSHFIDHVTHTAWIGIPDSLPPVLHPIWYSLLKTWTTVKNKSISIIDILLNPMLEVPEDFLPYMPAGRGFKYFYEHFDEILNMLLNEYPKTAKKARARSIAVLNRHYRHLAFTRHLPILHSSLHNIRSGGKTLRYADDSGGGILNAVIDLSALSYNMQATKMSEDRISAHLHSIYVSAMTYYQGLIAKKLNGKPALLRKHVFGTRIHWSLRTVVTPHDRLLPMDEVILPWGIILNCVKLQILNFLTNKYHKTMEEAVRIFMRAMKKYDPDVDHIVERILYEFPDHKMPLEIGRNPTIAYGSIMKLYVREFRKDPQDETLSINACIVSRANIGMSGTVDSGRDSGTEKIAA